MQRATLPFTRDLVLIGGGHAHALVLRAWAMDPLPGARLTVIDPALTPAYSGMLPGMVAGHYKREALEFDLPRLCRAAGARLIPLPATGLDLGAREVTLPGRPPVGFDVASIDVGLRADLPDLPGFAAHGVPVKPLQGFAEAWEGWLARRPPGLARIAVIGAGLAGAELALAMAWRLDGAAITLLDHGPALAALRPRARRLVAARLAAAGITVIEGARVAEVAADHLTLTDGRRIASDFTLGAAGGRPPSWLGETGLAVAPDGGLAVDARLRTSDPMILAAGDCATMTESPRPRAGVFAVRQAPILVHNLRRALAGRGTWRSYRPQCDYLKLVSLGGKVAMAEKWGVVLAAPALWRHKDAIDRAFMRRLNRPPAMIAPPPPLIAAEGAREGLRAGPPCQGCGAKVGRGALRSALQGMPPGPDWLISGPGEDAALIAQGDRVQVMTTDQLSAVTLDPVLMTRITVIHALGDLWAMGARLQAATLSLILPEMSEALQRRTLSEIIATATEVIGAEGGALVGGHSALGPGLVIGLGLTGWSEGAPLRQSGGRAGDALVLTKALGTGTILAAEMRGRVAPRDLHAAHQAMVVPQGEAARRLIAHGARAMTDVTGFGLAGHLAGLAEASGTGARIDLSALPILPGAEALAASGLRSSLWASNRAGAGPVFGATGPRGALLFDPQTCGGLLAALPAPKAPEAVAELRALGLPAAIIGQLTEGPGILVS